MVSVHGRDRFIVLVELEGSDLGVFVDFDSVQGSVLEKEAVEFGPDDVPCHVVFAHHGEVVV